MSGNVALRFSGVISVYSMDIPYHAACGTCAQLSSYAESEITSLVPQASPSFPSFPIRTASDGKLGRSMGTSTQCEPESFSQYIFCCGGMPSVYVATKCTKLRAICDHYLTESTCSKY